MAKFIQTLRNNWKKSVFFSGVLVYGVNYAKDKWKENDIMRKFAIEAARYGEKSIPLANTRPYHVTVILNPAANGGKSRKNYEEYCAPLLHLAGLKVSVIRTEAQSTEIPFFVSSQSLIDKTQYPLPPDAILTSMSRQPKESYRNSKKLQKYLRIL